MKTAMNARMKQALKKQNRVPKLDLKQLLTEDALASVAGKSGVYSVHTDGVVCDTSKGCNCKT